MRMKKIISILMATALSTGMTVTAFAGSWGKNATGWFYLKDNGQYATNEWETINGKYYYFDGDGYMLSGTTTPDGYTVNADGAWTENGIVQIQQSLDPSILYSDTVKNLIKYVWDGATEEKYLSLSFYHKIYDPLYFTGAGASDKQKQDILYRVITCLPDETGISGNGQYKFNISKEQAEAILSETIGASYKGNDYEIHAGDYGCSWPINSVTSISKTSDDIYGLAGVIGYENDEGDKDLTNFYATVQLNPSSRYGVTILSLQTGF